jgi:MFS family permease
MMDPAIRDQVQKARKRFFAIATSYFMGLFNDNFYKEAALIIAVTQDNTAIQSAAAAVFTVCYMLGAAPGGWLADRFAKGHVIVGAKAVELAAMIVGAVGMWQGNWALALTMIGLMGAQSAVFSPSMNGSIPELYPKAYVQTANTFIRILSTAAIFIGMALAGWVMDLDRPFRGDLPLGVFLVGLLVLIAATVGFVISFWAPRIAPQRVAVGFPWSGPVESVRELVKIRRDPLLAVCVYGNIYAWSMAAVMTLLMVNLGIKQLGITASMTALMKIVFLIGIAVGGSLSNWIAKGRKFFGVFIPAYAIMAALLIMVGLTPLLISAYSGYVIAGLIALAGIAGGVILVPLESFIQIRPPANEKGRVIAAANFAVFAGMTVGAGLLYVMNRWFLPTTSMGILGLLTALYTIWLARRLARVETEDF